MPLEAPVTSASVPLILMLIPVLEPAHSPLFDVVVALPIVDHLKAADDPTTARNLVNLVLDRVERSDLDAGVLNVRRTGPNV
jgi:hypothetical protein